MEDAYYLDRFVLYCSICSVIASKSREFANASIKHKIGSIKDFTLGA